jgi:hypothetical protein
MKLAPRDGFEPPTNGLTVPYIVNFFSDLEQPKESKSM